MRIISFASEKGGVGKTTTTVNVALHLASFGLKVLVVDLDGQGNASRFFGYIKDGKPTTAELIYNKVAGIESNYGDFIRNSDFNNLDYIPSSQMLTGITNFMANSQESNYVLKSIFSSDFFEYNYDYVLFDCRTLLDLLVSNALNASGYVIIPVEGGIYSFDGLSKMLDKVNSIKASTNKSLELLGIVLNKQNRTVVSTSVEESIREEYKDDVFVTVVPYLPAQCESNVLGNLKSNNLNIAFHNLATEVAYRINKKENGNEEGS